MWHSFGIIYDYKNPETLDDIVKGDSVCTILG